MGRRPLSLAGRRPSSPIVCPPFPQACLCPPSPSAPGHQSCGVGARPNDLVLTTSVKTLCKEGPILQFWGEDSNTRMWGYHSAGHGLYTPGEQRMSPLCSLLDPRSQHCAGHQAKHSRSAVLKVGSGNPGVPKTLPGSLLLRPDSVIDYCLPFPLSSSHWCAVRFPRRHVPPASTADHAAAGLRIQPDPVQPDQQTYVLNRKDRDFSYSVSLWKM